MSRAADARTTRALTSAATAALALSIGCVSEQTLAQNIANAARPSSLPLVVSCWEKEFEASEFRAEYVATMSFVVEGGTSHIRGAKVTSLDPSRDTPPRDPAAFTACVEGAMNRSTLPNTPTSEGPGFVHSWDVAVNRYRIAFLDASQNKRKMASKRQAYVLLGPRADRCQGLYTHDPPRDAATIYTQIDANNAMAARYKSSEPDLYAREIQKAYDAKLELRDRLALDLSDPGVPEANKKRVKKALEDTESSAKATGALIGCTPAPRASP